MHQEYYRRELEREWEWIEQEEKKLEAEQKKVVAEWVAVEDAQNDYNRKRENFEKLVQERFPFLPMDDIVSFNVGGELYKSTVRVWSRDRFSILAHLCTLKPKLPKLSVEEDAYYFDRDGWIFQFIYAFLRDSVLPDEIDILRELYCEASFYRIGLLRHAIEAKMIGEDAILGSDAFPKVKHSHSNLNENVKTVESTDSVLHTTSDINKKPASIDIANESIKPTNSSKFSKLPDPFGFTSKRL